MLSSLVCLHHTQETDEHRQWYDINSYHTVEYVLFQDKPGTSGVMEVNLIKSVNLKQILTVYSC